MVMQVRYLYEAEGNKKAKDAKAVSFFYFEGVNLVAVLVQHCRKACIVWLENNL